MRRLLSVLFAAGLAALTASPVAGQATASSGVNYRLDDGSTFQRGCFGPCDCPVGEVEPMRGTFRLTPSGSDPLYSYYAVTDVDWKVSQPAGVPLPIAGAGSFKIGGEVAITEQLSLDLLVGTDPVQHYDSGTIAPTVQFPLIDLTISIHGGYCFDTVLRVRARPFPKVEVGRDAIDWDPDPPATSYDVVRGDLAVLRASGGDYRAATDQCVANDVDTDSVPYALSPSPGGAFWILVRAAGGSYGAWDSSLATTRDAGIDAAPVSCP
jgi:hypothetical protein